MQIEIEVRPDHLCAVASGRFDPAQLEKVLNDIFATGSRHGHHKILIDTRTLLGPISAVARHQAAEIAAREAKFQRESVRLVFVGTDEQIWPDRFLENVANNRGVTTKVTTDMAEALDWLHR